jgi:cytoskeletal protein RodZ
MAESLGEKLRQAREARGLSLREVADQTRISARYLEGIEADDYKQLPGGVFNKGFIRSFAKYVGIDEKEALDDYSRQMNQIGESADEPIARKREVYIGDEPRSPVLTIVLALVILGLLTWGVIAALQWYQTRSTEVANTSPTNTSDVLNTANSNVGAPTPTPPVTAADGLNIVLTGGAQEVNITPTVDGKKQASFNLKPGESREFKAQNELKLQYAKARAGDIKMTVNGRPGKVTSEGPRPVSVEMAITRENFQQFLQ